MSLQFNDFADGFSDAFSQEIKVEIEKFFAVVCDARQWSLAKCFSSYLVVREVSIISITTQKR